MYAAGPSSNEASIESRPALVSYVGFATLDALAADRPALVGQSRVFTTKTAIPRRTVPPKTARRAVHALPASLVVLEVPAVGRELSVPEGLHSSATPVPAPLGHSPSIASPWPSQSTPSRSTQGEQLNLASQYLEIAQSAWEAHSILVGAEVLGPGVGVEVGDGVGSKVGASVGATVGAPEVGTSVG